MRRTIASMSGLATVFALPLLWGSPAAADRHREAYGSHCASCHGADGTADTPAARAMKISSFAGSGLADLEPEAICEKVKGLDKHASMLDEVHERPHAPHDSELRRTEGLADEGDRRERG